MTESHDALISRAALGDRQALSDLISEFGPQVRRGLVGKIDVKWQSVLSVDDVLQETYADAMVGISRFEPRGPDAFLRWLHTLARHNLLTAVEGLQAAKRGGDRTRADTEADSYVNLFERVGGTATSPSMHARQAEARTIVDEAFRKMPENYRLVLSLYDLAGCSVDDVCEACGCSPGAMFMRRRRALEMLQGLIGSRSNLL